MLSILPTEIVCMITEHCLPTDQASLSQLCRRFYAICKPILYKTDVLHHDSSAVFHAIVYGKGQHHALKILEAAKEAGADFLYCRGACKHQPPSSSLHVNNALHSPIHLAARRGLYPIVSFLIDHGLPADGPEALSAGEMTPLEEAICNSEEHTAILLVQRGAVVGLQAPKPEAFRAAIQQGLVSLVSVLVKQRGLDINADLGYGCTPMTVAICYRQRPMVRRLIHLGADAATTVRGLCEDHSFSSLLWTLEDGSAEDELAGYELTPIWESLGAKVLLDLVLSITLERVSPIQKCYQIAALERVLVLLQDIITKSRLEHGLLLQQQLGDTLDSLLHIVLSVDRVDVDLAPLLLRSGARMHVGVFLPMIKVFRSSSFQNDPLRCLRRYPRLLQCFDFVSCYYLESDGQEDDFAKTSFLQRAPSQAFHLVYELKRRNLPLTVRGIRTMEIIESRGEVQA